MRILRGSIRRARGDSDGALVDHLHAISLAREGAPLELVHALFTCATTYAERGEPDEARALVEQAIPTVRATGVARGAFELAAFAESLNARDAVCDAMEANPPPREIPWRKATRLALRGDFGDAADIFAASEVRTYEALMRLYGGERLIAHGQRAEGEAELRRALDFYRTVGATEYLQRGEALLAHTA